MDVNSLVKRLAYLQKESAELQVRLCNWTITTAEDRDAVREDVNRLKWQFDMLADEVGVD